MNIDSLLQPYQRFGINLGLERIEQLLADLGNPHHRVPIIHVAGTNGKGSVCAYLSAILTEAGYRVGRYTSPHLVDWTECICLNEQPIAAQELGQILLQIQALIPEDAEDSPTQFEVITAAAWLYFAQQQVDIAVIEVGLGGRLDSTNVCDNPLVSIITSLSREHWQLLGPTLADIAGEKAGILKLNCPAVIGPLPSEAKQVISPRVEQLNCPTVWVEPATELKVPQAQYNFNEKLIPRWASYQGMEYPLPLLGDIQLINSAIAIAALTILQQQGWGITQEAIVTGMTKTSWPGRLQWTSWHNHPILIDGAHNSASAQALRRYVDTFHTPITWVMGILATKDHAEIFQALLKPSDRLYLVPVPDYRSAEPEKLQEIAKDIEPQLTNCRTYPQLELGLQAATSNPLDSQGLIVLCGSLYLIGHFFKTIA
ncbi:MAG: bifunctional folylpolyglutamate synthase/dihydrofolate synthase [Symploca sp. SIO3E6]|nr:bifunctional folylpolyglutamate synthase/dihydrofolate synthase [Caldora sp. SIO3E6]